MAGAVIVLGTRRGATMVASKGYEARKAARAAELMRHLRAPMSPHGVYWTVSDAQLKRDLRPRTLRDVYRENKVGREEVAPLSSGPRHHVDKWGNVDASAYLAWCESIGHTPHPASIDPDHELNKWRERCPPKQTIGDREWFAMRADEAAEREREKQEDRPMNAKQMIRAVVNKAIAKGSPVIVEKRAGPSIDYARAVLRRLEETADLEPESLERREALQAAR